MLICESWKEGGEKDLIGQEEEKEFKQKEEKVPRCSIQCPLLVCLSHGPTLVLHLSGWNQPKPHHSLPTLLSPTPPV